MDCKCEWYFYSSSLYAPIYFTSLRHGTISKYHICFKYLSHSESFYDFFFLWILSFQYVYLGRLHYGIWYQRNEINVCSSLCWWFNNTLSGWRLSPFYIALGVALLMWPNSLWLSSVVGVQLLFLAILRLFTVIRHQNNTNKCESLLQKHPNSREYFEK